MITKPMQRALSLVSALAMLLTVLVVPAFAAEPTASATLDVAEDALVPAGMPHTYSLTVTNTGANPSDFQKLLGGEAGATIDAVVVTVPSYFATFQTTNVVPEGWESALLSSNRLIMRRGLDAEGNPTGSPLTPGQSFTFGVSTNVAPQAYDDGARFAVAVSSDRGRSLEAASVAVGGTLDSAVKILEILGLTIDGPAGATDATVTDGQDNVTITATVQSYSSVPLEIAPTITSEGSPTVTSTLQSGNTSLAAGANETYTFLTSFDGVGSITLNAAATGSVDGEQRASAVGDDDLDINGTVQEATAFAYRSTDTDLVSTGQATVTVAFDKTGVPTGSTVAGVTLIGPSGNTKPATVTTNPVSFDGGSQTVTVTFSADFSATDPQGLYDANFTFVGTDGNDADIDLAVSVLDILTFDASLPTVTVNLGLPEGSAVDGEVPAAGNGRELRIFGQVSDNGSLCGACALSYTLKANGQTIGEPGRALSNNSGSFDTTIDVSGLPSGFQNGLLSVSVLALDAAGNGPASNSATTFFDTKPAAIEDSFPVTGGIGEAVDGGSVVLDRIDVIFPEGVAVPFRSLAAQWSVTGKGVQAVEIVKVTTDQDLTIQRAERDADGNRTVAVSKTYPAGSTLWLARLDLDSDLAGNELPTVTYDPDANAGGSGTLTGSQTRIYDRVSLTTLKGVRQAFDNIAPALPVLTAVDGAPQYFDDSGVKTFWSNGGDTLLSIGNVAQGTTVEVYVDGTKVAEQDNTSSSTTSIVVEANLGAQEGPVTIGLRALDSGVKTSGLGTHEIRIDTTAPVALGATRDDNDTVTITVSDVLISGADADLDFVVIATDSRGRTIALNVVDVARPAGAEGDPATMGFENFQKLNRRVLTVDSTSYDLSGLTFQSVEYDGQFGPEAAYGDRAGNTLNSPSSFGF